MPVEIIIGFLVFAILNIKLVSVISNDEILNNLTLNFFKKINCSNTKGVLNSGSLILCYFKKHLHAI